MLILFVDIDECSLGGNVCHDGLDCENTIGSYRCVMRCGRGFRRTADGLSCSGTSKGFNLCTKHLLKSEADTKLLTVVVFVFKMWTSARSPIRAINTVWTRLAAIDAPVSRDFSSGTDAVSVNSFISPFHALSVLVILKCCLYETSSRADLSLSSPQI